ncbi:non-structural maintenance of chromosomes element 4 homolog A-like [Bidens hawaiensis]|uniref:non-structural maintenance of chromosomes element 4 homolog A-like n=1 Tax=Bidens hawaiensis TaxID=980011 RepID=UPI0040497296
MSTNQTDINKQPKDTVTDDQSADDNFSKRRVLRHSYLSIQNLIRDKKDEISAVSSKWFLSIMDEVDGMHHLGGGYSDLCIEYYNIVVNKPREQVSDAEALRDLADTLVTSIRVHSTGNVNPSVFVSSLISRFGKKRKIGINESVKIRWKDIGLQASSLFMTGSGSSTMFGPMNLEPKPSKASATRKRQRSVKAEKVTPEELEDAASKGKTETEKTIATMFDILKVNKKVRLENLVFNRISFAQTVENLFALSFLVKDGRVLIMVHDDGSHYVSPRNAPASSMITSKKVVYSHFIFRFDFNDWKLMSNLVAEDSELMPHRTKLNLCDGSQLEPNSSATSSQTTRTSTKTSSKRSKKA